jgi:uncharacterized lipoprotein YajG
MNKNLVVLIAVIVLFAQCSKKDSTQNSSNNLNTKSVGASAKEFLNAGT